MNDPHTRTNKAPIFLSLRRQYPPYPPGGLYPFLTLPRQAAPLPGFSPPRFPLSGVLPPRFPLFGVGGVSMLPSCIPGTDERLRRAACADRTLWSTSPERQGPPASGRLLFRGAVSCCCRRERTVQSKKTKSFRWLVCTQTKMKFGLRLRTVACTDYVYKSQQML